MSGDMPKVWWSPSDGGWFAKDPLGAFCALGSSYDVEGLPEDAVELAPVSAEHVDARALELSYWFGRLQYTKADDLPRLRGLMRERIEELDEQGDAIAYTAVSDSPPAPVDPRPDPQPVNRELLAKLRSGVTAVERPAPGESDDLLATFEPQCTQACSEMHTYWPGCLLWLAPPDPAEDEDLVAILDRYLAWWEISQDGMGPWPSDPDGGELRIVMALRDVLTQTSHVDVEALVRKKFTRGHDV